MYDEKKKFLNQKNLTDEALREAEGRSRKHLQKLDIANAMKQREAREKRTKDVEMQRTLSTKMKFNSAAWTGVLKSKSCDGFWTRKRVKLEIPIPFRAAVDSY